MAKAATKSTPALTFLASPEKYPVREVCVVFGDEPFLKRQAVALIRESVLQGEDAELSLSRLNGPEIEFRDVNDELSTVSLFGDQRLVEVQEADTFVQQHRSELEGYANKPRTSGVLLLVVNSWPSNTRLFKLLNETGLQIDCKRPKGAAVLRWISDQAKRCHQTSIDPAAAEQLLEIVGPDFGLLDQELAKLALVAGEGGISIDSVREMAGSWRTRTVWELLDAACDGRAKDALSNLDRLLLAGEHPIAILGQIASSLRRFATATQLYVDSELAGRRMPLRDSLQQAGVPPFKLRDAERQLKRMGRARTAALSRQLLETDLALKGVSSAPDKARLKLEQLLAQIAAPSQPQANRPRAAASAR